MNHPARLESHTGDRRNRQRRFFSSLLILVTLSLLAGLTSGCSIVRAGPDSGGRSVQISGLVDGFLAFGLSNEKRYVNVRVLGGSSSGALAEIVVWKIARLEIGAAGVSVGLLPFHVGLGALFYEPRLPHLRPFEPGEDDDFFEEAEPDAMGADTPDADTTGAGPKPIDEDL